MGFFQSGSFSKGFFSPPSGVIGELYNKSNWADLTDFTVTGFTPTIVANKININAGNSDFNRYMVFDQYSCDEKQSISVEYTWDAENPTHGASLGVGRRSAIGTAINNEMHYDPRSGNKIMQYWVSGSLKGSKSIDVGAVVGHTLRLTFTQNKNVITGTIENLSNGQSGSYTVAGNLAASKNWQLANVAKPCIWNHGGTQTIQKIRLSSATLKSPLAVTIGDSKTHGYSAESAGGRWGELYANPYVAVFGGDGDKTNECLQGIPYITSRMKPRYAVLAIGCNDLRSGVSSGTWQANYASIVSQLEAAGITVIHLLPLPEASLDQSSLKSWIQSTYSTGKLVDPSVGWTNAIHLSTDNVHPSYAGHQLAVQKIIESGYISGLFPQVAGPAIGTLYSKSSWADLTDFTATGFTPTISSNEILFSGGGGNFNQYMVFDQYSADEKLTISVEYTLTTVNDGISVGRRSDIGSAYFNTMHYYPGSNGPRWLFWQNGALKGEKIVSVGAVAGHRLRLTFTQNKNVVTGTIENITNGQTDTYSVTSNLDVSLNFPVVNVAKPCIWNHSGSMTIHQITLSSATLKRPLAVTLGDSKTMGLAAGNAEGRWSELLANPNVAVFGGGGDKTAECLQGISYITARMQPQFAVLAIGSNDIRGGVASGTWQANYTSIVNALEAAGITVIHLLPIPENGLDQSALKSWIESTYASGKLVDPSVGWVNGTHLSADNIHPNYAGHQFTAQKVVDSGYLPTVFFSDGIAANAHLAISFARVVRTGYTGNAFKVRRSSDNATQVIGYTGGALDTTSLLAFIGAASGYIEGFWEQSVNNHYFEQLTTSKQARIVNAGTLDTQGGKPAPYFDGSDYYALATNGLGTLTFNYATICSITSVISFNGDGGNLIGGTGNNSFQYRLRNSQKQNLVRQSIIEWGVSTSTFSLSTLTQLSARARPAAGTADFRMNGADNGTLSFTGYTFSSQSLQIGAMLTAGNPVEQLVGYLSEMIVYPDSLNGIVHSVELDQGAFYGVSVA